LSFIPTVNNQVAKFVHFILHLFLFFLYPLLITPPREPASNSLLQLSLN